MQHPEKLQPFYHVETVKKEINFTSLKWFLFHAKSIVPILNHLPSFQNCIQSISELTERYKIREFRRKGSLLFILCQIQQQGHYHQHQAILLSKHFELLKFWNVFHTKYVVPNESKGIKKRSKDCSKFTNLDLSTCFQVAVILSFSSTAFSSSTFSSTSSFFPLFCT